MATRQKIRILWVSPGSPRVLPPALGVDRSPSDPMTLSTATSPAPPLAAVPPPSHVAASPRHHPGGGCSPGSGTEPTARKGDIVELISEVVVVEQILIRNLPPGTKAALRARAKERHRSVEAEARDVLTRALEGEAVTIVDLLGTDEGADVDFEPERLGLTARSAEL